MSKAGWNTETPLFQETLPKKSEILSSKNMEIDLDKAIQDDWDEAIKRRDASMTIVPLPPEYQINED